MPRNLTPEELASLRMPKPSTPGASTGFRLPTTPQVSIPAAGGGGKKTAGGGGGGGLPDVKKLNIKAEAPKELTEHAQRNVDYLSDLESGTGRVMDVQRAQHEADLERQVKAAREQAAAEGRPFDEGAFRAELKRGQYGALAEQAIGREALRGEAIRGALPSIQAPSQAQLAQRAQSATEEGMLLDYTLGKYGAETGRISANNQANQAWLSMLSNMFNVSAQY